MLKDVFYARGSGTLLNARGSHAGAFASGAQARGRLPVDHRVKSWPPLFEATRLGLKKHDLRRASERDYRVGDTLTLREYDPSSRSYTGRELVRVITYLTSADFPCALSGDGLHPEYCILSLAEP